uniref:cDNA FLJ45995 fis, clone SKNMC2003639 n=1 Tax=Homo sapiens TaxID=9606 RepID=Q6ZRY0_HUMAN|nr:unnamed protein product [Homo sapiens]
MRVPRHPGGSHRSAVGLLCEKGPAAPSLVQIRCQTVFLGIHPNRSLISLCGSPGPPSRPEPKCLGSRERPVPFFSSLATSSHFRLLTVPKQPPKTLRELGPGPEAENGRKKRSGRFIKLSLQILQYRHCLLSSLWMVCTHPCLQVFRKNAQELF